MHKSCITFVGTTPLFHITMKQLSTPTATVATTATTVTSWLATPSSKSNLLTSLLLGLGLLVINTNLTHAQTTVSKQQTAVVTTAPTTNLASSPATANISSQTPVASISQATPSSTINPDDPYSYYITYDSYFRDANEVTPTAQREFVAKFATLVMQQEFAAAKVKSMVILPPTSQAFSLDEEYSYQLLLFNLLADRGYYVINPATSNDFFLSQGLNTAGDIQRLDRSKIFDYFGVDAIIVPNVTSYGAYTNFISRGFALDGKFTVVTRHSSLPFTVETELYGNQQYAELSVKGILGHLTSSTLQAWLDDAIEGNNKVYYNVNNVLYRRIPATTSYNYLFPVDNANAVPYGPYHIYYKSDFQLDKRNYRLGDKEIK